MSDNELRDRIAKAIDRGFNNGADLNDYEAETQAMAQAVIDDLGLEVVSDGGRPEWKLQIVGRWEKQ